ncbi:hypothetical protein HCG51_03950 [Tolypothrix sp. PCC 7910]|nr:hypothetical protein HCG51_03950 [Tolypothrix sp. PCC 7910]
MYEYFELHRLSDDLVYEFDRRQREDATFAYQRRDQDLWIIFKPDYGWIAYNEATHEVQGRPWDVLPQHQGDHPPPGIWVSRKGTKSYVYELKYPNKATAFGEQ